MNKKITLIVALCSFFLISQGQVLLDETFDYSVSDLDFAPGWTSGGTAPAVVPVRNIVTPPLTYITTDGTYVLSDKGKTMNNVYISGATGYYCYKLFTATPVTSTVYLTYLFKAGVAQKQSQSEVIGLGDSANSGPKVWVGKGSVTANFKLGTTRGSGTGADVKWRATEFTDTLAVILVVLKYDFATETSSLFINPTLGSTTEPIPDVIDDISNPSALKSDLSSIRFRVNGNNKANFNVSGARVSSSWANAVAKVSQVGLSELVTAKNTVKIFNNPSANTLNLEYSLTNNSNVNLVLYNINGQVVNTLIQNIGHEAGSHTESFDVSGLTTGIYLVRFTAGGVTKSFKILINQ